MGVEDDIEVIMNALTDLKSLSFITMKPDDKSFRVHRLLQKWIRAQPEVRDNRRSWQKLSVSMINSGLVLESDRALKEWEYEQTIKPHIEHCYEFFNPSSTPDTQDVDDSTRSTIGSLAKVYEYYCDPEKAKNLYDRALKDVKDHCTDIRVLRMMNDLGLQLALQKPGDSNALKWHERART